MIEEKSVKKEEPLKVMELDINQLTSLLELFSKGEKIPYLTFEGMEKRADFSRLFKFRTNPERIVETLLKEKISRIPKPPKERKAQILNYVGISTPEDRALRFKLRQEELELKKRKIESLSVMNEVLEEVLRQVILINKRLDRLEKGKEVI